MSSYGNITTRIIDSVFDRANLRAEFRLPADSVYLSNMRLIGLGIFSSTAASSYNELLGAYGGIKNISVFDGATLLEQMNQAEIVNAFKSVQSDNDSNLSVNRHLKYNQLGFTANGDYSLTANQIGANSIQVKEQNLVANNVNKRAWLSLKEHLSFFKSSMSIPTNVFKQFRIVIEYLNSAEMKHSTSVNNATLSTGESATANPNVLLLVDEVNEGDMRNAMMKNYQGVVYRPLEVDSVNLGALTPAANTETAQTQTYLVNGFDGKKLIRILQVNSPQLASTFENATDNTNLGGKGSQCLFRSGLQIRVNGANKLSGQGIVATSTGSVGNRRLAYLVDTWGNANIITGGNVPTFGNEANFYDATTTPYVGNLDYTGCLIDEVISELQIQVERSGVAGNNDLNQAIRLFFVGEVERAIVMASDGSYNVVYTN